MKQRQPNTIEDAIMRISGELSPDGAAAVIERSRGRIYAAADRDRENFSPLNIEQCIKLDAAFNEATGQGFPLLEVYRRQVKARSAHRIADRTARILSAVRECAEAVEVFGDDEAPQADVEREIDEAIRALEAMRLDRRAGLRVVEAAE